MINNDIPSLIGIYHFPLLPSCFHLFELVGVRCLGVSGLEECFLGLLLVFKIYKEVFIDYESIVNVMGLNVLVFIDLSHTLYWNPFFLVRRFASQVKDLRWCLERSQRYLCLLLFRFC